MRRAWVLNLDADEELRHPAGYKRSAAMARRIETFIPHARALALPGDVILEAGSPRLQGEYLGRSWCPTPSALAALRRAGANLARTSALDVLRRVNQRGFCAELGQSLAGARFVRSMGELLDHVAGHSSRVWLLKRPHGFAGRGNRKCELPRCDAATARGIEATLRRDGGLQLEPWVERERDFGQHGYVEESGATRLGAPTVQECDARGTWRQTHVALRGDFATAELEALQESASITASALAAAGYFGPFGIDAYRWRDGAGRLHFNPRSEINARYTMGWHVGMGDWRPEA